MNSLLVHDRTQLHSILSATLEEAIRYFSRQNNLPPALHSEPAGLAALHETGLGAAETLRLFARDFAPFMSNSAGPRYFGFVTGGSTPAAVAGDWLVSVFDQVMSGSTDSAAHNIETQTLCFLKELFGLGHAFEGTFVTGATMANFVCLATAREWAGAQMGVSINEQGVPSDDAIRIFSATPHSSILKCLSMLGLGRQSLVKIKTLPGREAIDTHDLEKHLSSHNGTAIVVASAGTVNTVDFDDLNTLSALREKYNFWLHTDAAFGGFARISPRFSHLADGLEKADSVTIDAHKWLNVPYDAGMAFLRRRDLQVDVFRNNAAYLGDPSDAPDSMHLTPENSRRFRALPAWFTLMAYGRQGYREIVERNCDSARLLATLLAETTQFRVLADVKMNVVCFTLAETGTNASEIRRFLNLVRDDGQVFFTPTELHGIPAIRAAISNWQTTEKDIHTGFSALRKVYDKWMTTRVAV